MRSVRDFELKIGWDNPLPGSIISAHKKLVVKFKNLYNIKFTRYSLDENQIYARHAMLDISVLAYGYVTYASNENASN